MYNLNNKINLYDLIIKNIEHFWELVKGINMKKTEILVN